ncbi:MAG: Uncharacterized protein FD143_2591 [Ignavibacteria bacterium]|nr:MAG: Uncharacterized protein FD143_2591 [Ignavibacteria bacterium]KAF0160373.1 MAG: Uncharacterized protein FD188_1751 [Ignavibacteria bacterium]
MNSVNKTGKRKFFIRTLLPTALTIILFISVFFFLFIPHYENTIMDRKREMTKELINSAWSILEKWHRVQLEENVSELYAKEMAVSQIQSLRYGDEGKDYFWITDFAPKMVMHPYRTDLNNRDLSSFKDLQGKALFVEMAEKAKKNGNGFVDYMWQWKDDSTKIVPKLSYVKSFTPWNWVIGTGIYIEDVKNQIAQLESKILNASIGITFLISILLIFIAYQNLTSENERLRAERELHESREKYRALVEASSEGLILILESKQIFYNKTIYNLLGYDDASSIELPKIFEDDPKLKSVNIETLELEVENSSSIERTEAMVKRQDGSILHALLIVSPISFMNSKGIVISVKDITPTKRIEEELDKSKEKYISLTNQLSIGVFRLEGKRDYKFLEANQAAIKLFQLSKENPVTDYSLANLLGNGFDSFKEELKTAGAVQNKILTLAGSDENIKSVSISAIIVKDNNGEENIIEGIIEDISQYSKTDAAQKELLYDLQTAFLFLMNSIEPYVKRIPLCQMQSTIIEAAAIMNNAEADCILIQDQNLTPVGILTSKDLQVRVLKNDCNLTRPVFEFMSSPLITLPQESNLYQAMMLSYSKNVSRLLVVNENREVQGVLSISGLQRSIHLSYMFFIQRINECLSAKELKFVNDELVFLIKQLVTRQTSIKDVTKIITSVSDAVFNKTVELAIKQLGKPPVDFAFVVLGSAGRSEQTLATDQDNAIIFEDVSKDVEESVQHYFIKLGEMICIDLNQIGYSFCKGGVMAKNAKWCQPISVWKEYFTNWITTSAPQDLLEVKIFFDFRNIYGKKDLTEHLENHINRITSGYNSFYVFLSESIARFQIPEAAVKHKTSFDVKLLLLPVVDFLRLYCLSKKISAKNSLERIEQLYLKGFITKSFHKQLRHAYTFLMQKRFEHQSDQLNKRETADNLVNPSDLSELDLVILKKAISVIEDMQAKANLEFKGTAS